MSSQQYALRWVNHNKTFINTLFTLRGKEKYCDATLACNGVYYEVHRFVLSTCSEYFEEIFDRTECKHPVIILKDVCPDDLEALLNYMYIGEVNVPQDSLERLVKNAENLKIKGLAVPDEQNKSPLDRSKEKFSFGEEDDPKPKRTKTDRTFTSPAVVVGPARNYSRIHNALIESYPIVHNASADKTQSVHNASRETSRSVHNVSAESIPSVHDASPERSPSVVAQEEEKSSVDESTSKKNEIEATSENSSVKANPQNQIFFQGSNSSFEPIILKVEPLSADEDTFSEFDVVNMNTVESSDDDEPSVEDAMVDPRDPAWEPEILHTESLANDITLEHFSMNPELSNQAIVGHEIFSGSSLTCEKCNKAFPSMEDLMSHLQTPCIKKEMILTCRICNYQSSSEPDYMRHMNTHKVAKPYGCPFCNYRTAVTSSLRVHLRRHTGEKPYACPICPYRATMKSSIGVHMKNHNGERPFACTVCPYKALTWSALAKHKRTHSGEKPFQCTMCHYKSADKSNLRDHMLVHSDNRPHPCHLCPYKAKKKADLNRHLKRHAKKQFKLFTC